MPFEQITVCTRDEYRDAQEPLSFEWRHKRFEIARIVDRWYEGYLDPTRMPLRYFKVETGNGRQYILRFHEFFQAWSLLATDQKMENGLEMED
jgi:hypothetical protein